MHIKVSEQGNVIEISRLEHRNLECPILKLSADEYVIASEGTGEIHEIEHGTSRADAAKTVRQSFRNLRAIINTNAQEPKKMRWITLTYAENMTDTTRLYEDFRRFWQRFKRRKWGKGAEYITVAEPQGRGAWHLHLLVLYPNRKRAPFIPNAELRECWRFGFVDVKAVKNVDNIGAYLSAYVTNIDVTNDPDNRDYADLVEVMSDGTEKRYIKGARLNLYPAGMNIYRCSRGIKKPVERWVSEPEAIEIIADATKTFERTYGFETDGFCQTVIKEFYNKARKEEENGTS